MNRQQLLATLRRALEQPESLPAIVAEFQHAVWDADSLPDLTEQETEVIRTLAYDLDFFEPEPEGRKQDAAFFGPERAVQEIQQALVALGERL